MHEKVLNELFSEHLKEILWEYLYDHFGKDKPVYGYRWCS